MASWCYDRGIVKNFAFSPGKPTGRPRKFTVLHGRAAHQLVPDEDQKRVLIRIWVDFPDYQRFGNEALMRYGVVRHGQLGWSVQQLLAGANREPHARQQNGLPVA